MSIYYEMTGSPRAAGFKTKAELIAHLEGFGYVKDDLAGVGHGKVAEKVCNLLLTDAYNSKSGKMAKAKKRGIRILTYEDLLNELDEGATPDDESLNGEENTVNGKIDYNSMKIAELKELLKERALPVSGTKAELIERFQNSISENLRKFIFSNDPGMRKMGLSMAKGLNTTESHGMIKTLAKWDPEHSGYAKLLMEELGIDDSWTEEEEAEIMTHMLKKKPTDIMWFILDNQGIHTDQNIENTPESCGHLQEIIEVLANDEDVDHKNKLLNLIDELQCAHYDIIFGVIRTAVEKEWEDVITILLDIISDDWSDHYVRNEAKDALRSFSKESILSDLGVEQEVIDILLD